MGEQPAVKKVFDNLASIVTHLRKIVFKTDRIAHHPKTIENARKHLRFLTDKRAISLMVYNLDAQNAFSKKSHLFETEDASIIELSEASKNLRMTC